MNIINRTPQEELAERIKRLRESGPQGGISISNNTIGVFFPERDTINAALLYFANPNQPTIPEPTFRDRIDKFCTENSVHYFFDPRIQEHIFHFKDS